MTIIRVSKKALLRVIESVMINMFRENSVTVSVTQGNRWATPAKEAYNTIMEMEYDHVVKRFTMIKSSFN